MPDYPTVLEIMKRGDSGLLFLVVITVFSVFALVYLAEKRRIYRIGIQRLAPLAIPVSTAAINPPLGIIAFVTSLLPGRITIPRRIPVLPALILLGLILRLPLINDSLWYDEAVTRQIVTMPLPTLPQVIMTDVHPPLYYVLLWAWVQVAGNSPAALRLPSIVLSLVSIYLMWRAAALLFRHKTAALWAAGLMATLPASINYGTEVRSYVMLTDVVLLAFIAILESKPKLLALMLVILPFLHNAGYFYSGFLMLGAVGLHWNDKRRWIWASAAGMIAGAVWMPALLFQSQYVGDGLYWVYITPGAVFWPLLNMTVGVIGQKFNTAIVIPVIGISAYCIWYILREKRQPKTYVWLAIALGVPLVDAVVSFVWQPIYIYRHFLPSMMILCIGWAYVLSRSRLITSIMVPVLVIALVAFYTDGLPGVRPDYRSMIAEYCSEADAFFGTSINATFLSHSNDPRPTLAWTLAQDNGMSFESNIFTIFEMPTGDILQLEGQTVCIMQIDIPASSNAERAYVAEILATYPHVTNRVHFNSWNDLYFHLVEVQ